MQFPVNFVCFLMAFGPWLWVSFAPHLCILSGQTEAIIFFNHHVFLSLIQCKLVVLLSSSTIVIYELLCLITRTPFPTVGSLSYPLPWDVHCETSCPSFFPGRSYLSVIFAVHCLHFLSVCRTFFSDNRLFAMKFKLCMCLWSHLLCSYVMLIKVL